MLVLELQGGRFTIDKDGNEWLLKVEDKYFDVAIYLRLRNRDLKRIKNFMGRIVDEQGR